MSDTRILTLGRSSLQSSRLAYGCWRIADAEDRSGAAGQAAVRVAFESGYTLFDLADIYGQGRSEILFGKVLRETSGLRAQVLIATKCGIRLAGDPTPNAPHRYDLSARHIVASCEQSLQRLGIEQIDLYQLHRPDWLMNPEEIAAAFVQLREQGKVREFGVSNFRPSQVKALQAALPFPLVVNQVEMSLACLRSFEDGTLDQCLSEKITPVAWSPLAGGLLADGARNLLPSQEAYRVDRILTELDAQAAAHGTSRGNIALAWLLEHPAGIVPIIGSTQPDFIRIAAQALQIDLGRENWYRLLEAARGERLP